VIVVALDVEGGAPMDQLVPVFQSVDEPPPVHVGYELLWVKETEPMGRLLEAGNKVKTKPSLFATVEG
jgi:hypothetical protein